MNRRRSASNLNITQILLVAICVLMVLLIAVICIALFTGGKDPGDASTGPQGTTVGTIGGTDGTTEGTDGTTEPTSEPLPLIFTSPEVSADSAETEYHIVSMDQNIQFSGTSDPAVELSINGGRVNRAADGSFSFGAQLSMGMNTFVFSYMDKTVTFQVDYRYVVETFAPAGDQIYNSGASIYFKVSARTGSTVQATVNGTTVTLQPSVNQAGSGAAPGFSMYTGNYLLPNTNTEDLSLGQITYTAVYNGITETYTSGSITCKKSGQILASDPSVTPNGGSYIDVGSGYICEVINYSAETFLGQTIDDTSRPYMSYLPEGTMDYASTQQVTCDGKNYLILRCGRRIYVKKDNPPATRTQVVDCYAGTLPDHNEIGFVSMEETGRYTVMTLDSMWKAPFYFETLPQVYGAEPKFSVTACTYEYIDITFCYATKFTGTVEIPADNVLFNHAEVIQREYDCTLRLYLKKVGAFYGWDAYYNDAGQLCFKFLNPAKVTKADNAFGVDMTGVRVMIDVGHGGVDGGSTQYAANGSRVEEADRNLALALELKTQLESMGATVLMNRATDVSVTVDERILLMRNSELDYQIAIHHNGSQNTSVRGFQALYYAAYSRLATEHIYATTNASGIYSYSGMGWHYYFMGRQSYCPTVLTENGYMTNPDDLAVIIDPAYTVAKAQALAQGIANYFLAVNGLY